MTDSPPTPSSENPEPKKKSDLIPRLMTAIVAVPILLALLFVAPTWAFAILIAAAVFIGAWEYTSITQGPDNRLAQVVTSLAALGVGCAMYLSATPTGAPNGDAVLLALSFGMIAIFFTHLFTYRDIEKVTLYIGSGAVALIYCGVCPAMLALLHRNGGELGGAWVFLAMAVVWGSDTGAYFVGRAFGKHKLAPRVSPKKSVEGAVGGLVSSILAVFIFQATLLPDLTLAQVFLIAIPANILGQLGDLCESIVKRAHGVKDSGVIIYGHGGLLDRIDALILAVPWIYIVQRFIAGNLFPTAG